MGEYLNLLEVAASPVDIFAAIAGFEVFLEAAAALWRLTMASNTQESLWNLMEVTASLCSLVEAGHSLQKISMHQNSL
jgi:hypothetical protein